jgi:type II secretory pathway pseudopilin PulG
MQRTRSTPSTAAFTRLDLIVVLLVVGCLAGLGLPVLAGARPRSQMVECVNNLRRVGQGFHLWANEYSSRYPWTVPPPDGGSMLASASQQFMVVSNEFVTPTFLVCPSDPARVRRRDWQSFASNGSSSLSYFAGLHASLNQPRIWLSGDRNIGGWEGRGCNLTQISPCTTVSPDSGSAWGNDLHAGVGNLLLGDGRVWQVSNRELRNLVQQATSQDPQGFIDLLKP